jgi:ubiquinone/menaquinone biosynthesis C-methylase UbiE
MMIDDGRSPRKHHALALFEGLPRYYDQMGALLSFGQDQRWRSALVSAVDPQPGERELDVATGTGMVTAALVRRSGCEVVALDQSEAMLAAGSSGAHFGGSPARNKDQLHRRRGRAASVRRRRV